MLFSPCVSMLCIATMQCVYSSLFFYDAANLLSSLTAPWKRQQVSKLLGSTTSGRFPLVSIVGLRADSKQAGVPLARS